MWSPNNGSGVRRYEKANPEVRNMKWVSHILGVSHERKTRRLHVYEPVATDAYASRWREFRTELNQSRSSCLTSCRAASITEPDSDG
jgi:hypothetical protein